MLWRRKKLKVEVPQVEKINCVCSLLRDIPLVCRDAVLPEPLLRNCTINCFTFEETTRQPYNLNLCLFRAVASHLHVNQKVEEISSEFSILILGRLDRLSPSQFHGVHMNDIPSNEDLLLLNFVLYVINITEGNIIGELAWHRVQNYENNVGLLIYINHICYLSKIRQPSNPFVALILIFCPKEHSIWSSI